jgi:hypothetical protein
MQTARAEEALTQMIDLQKRLAHEYDFVRAYIRFVWSTFRWSESVSRWNQLLSQRRSEYFLLERPFGAW